MSCDKNLLQLENLPMDLSCTAASGRDCDTRLDCTVRRSSPAPTFSSYRMDTWTLHSCSRQTRSPPQALAPWSRFRMALANKFWRLFYTCVGSKNSDDSDSPCLLLITSSPCRGQKTLHTFSFSLFFLVTFFYWNSSLSIFTSSSFQFNFLE